MYTRSFGKTLLILSLVLLAFLVGGVAGFISHTPPPPTNNVPAHVSQALAACMASLDQYAAAEVQWGDWAEIAGR